LGKKSIFVHPLSIPQTTFRFCRQNLKKKHFRIYSFCRLCQKKDPRMIGIYSVQLP
jgi:hypothetical protein